MYTSATTQKPEAKWQGLTKDGYTLLLTRAGMMRILSNLKRTGLSNLVKVSKNNSLNNVIMNLIAKVVSNANSLENLSSPDKSAIQVFTAVGKTRKYQILTQPLGSKKAGIIFIRSQPRDISTGYEYEDESEQMVGGNQTSRRRLGRTGRKRAKARNSRQGHQNPSTNSHTSNLPLQVRRKLNEIKRDSGHPGNHGRVTLTDGTQTNHYTAGDYRIFGHHDQTGRFHYKGYGQHTGKTNNEYKVKGWDGKDFTAYGKKGR